MNFSGADDIDVVTWTNELSISFQPHDIMGKILLYQCCTCQYTRKMCWFAAARVEGNDAKLKSDFLVDFKLWK